MNRPPPSTDGHEDKASLLSVELEQRRHDSVVTSPYLGPTKAPERRVSNGFLSAPLTGPVRPLSPDAISILSIEEYEQIRPGRTRGRSDGSIRAVSPSPELAHSGFRSRLQRFWIRNKGLSYMLLAQVFGTLMNVTTRLLEIEGNKGKGMHPYQILFVGMGITFFLASGYMWWKKTPHFPFGIPEVRWLLVVRGLAGFAGVFGMYYSLLYLPLADAVVITFLAPGLACWACSLLIAEPFTRAEKIGTLVSLIGVILIARPTSLFAAFGASDAPPASGTGDASPSGAGSSDASNYDNVTPVQRLSAVGIALIGVLGSATVFTVIRWIGKRAHPLISVNYFAAWCFLVSIVMQIILPEIGFVLPADLKEWGYLFFLGVCGFIMQFLLAAGLAYEKSSRATNITYTQMLFALSFDKMIFGHTPGIMSIIGSSLILGSAIVVAVQKDPNRGQQQEETEAIIGVDDEESQAGLLSETRGVITAQDHDPLPVESVQLRTLR